MIQWVYTQSEFHKDWGFDLWTVGFYDPDGRWQPESDHETAEAAAERVHWLNGGEKSRATAGEERRL